MQLTILMLSGAILTSTVDAVAAQDSVSWQMCVPLDDGPVVAGAECATIRLPLRYDLGEDSLGIAAMRVTGKQSLAQLWFLDGGPGDAGTASLSRLAGVLDLPDVDLYTVDHRGVGGSAVLRCPDQQAAHSPEGTEITKTEWPDCIRHIERARSDLDALTTLNSARDLGQVIELMREPNKQVVIMGVSYGTYLAQQYLRMVPQQPDAVILDGIVPPDWTFAEFDAGLDSQGRRVLAKCAAEIECADRLGPDPIQTAKILLDSLSNGHCNGIGLTPQLTRLVLGSMLMVDAVPHMFLPGFIYRVRRCAWHDRLAVLHMFREVFGDLAEPASHSQVLQRHVVMSELWPLESQDSLVFESALERYVMTTEVSASFARTVGKWPVYPRPSDSQSLVDYGGPLLLLHGGLDPTMPIERLASLREHYRAPHQTFVPFPEAGHVVINESSCAVGIYRAFIRNPSLAPDTACVSTLPAVSMKADVERSQFIFGTKDFWGDGVGTSDWLLFVTVFRFPALVVGFGAVLFGFVRRRRVAGRRSTRGAVRTTVMIVGWLLVSAVMWFGIFVTPMVMRYRLAVLLAVAMTVFHLTIGLWLVKWLSRVEVTV